MDERVLQTFKRQDVPNELLVGPNLKNLYRDLFLDWGIIIACSFLIHYTPFYFYPLWVMLIAGRLHGFGVLIHDISHMNLKNKTFFIRVFEFFAGYLIGTSANAMAYHHIRHHRNTLMDNDPYYNINKKCIGIVRFWLALKKGLFFIPFWITRSFVAPWALLFPPLRNPYARIFLQDVSNKDLREDPEVVTCAKEDLPIMFFHIVLFYLAYNYFEFLFYTYYAAAPVAGVFCIYRLLIEHEYDIVNDRSVYTMIESTFDHHLGAFDRLFVGPHNIGFHCIHHIHPSVGLHALPKLRQWYLEHSNQYQSKYLKPRKLNWKDDLFGGIHHS